MSKYETNSNLKSQTSETGRRSGSLARAARSRFEHLNFDPSNLFRISSFEFRIYATHAAASPAAAADHVGLRLGHPPRVQRPVQLRVGHELPLAGDLPHRLAGLEALLRDVGGLVV